MIVHWPAKITAGRVDDTPWAFADVLPTIAEITGATPSAMPGLAPNGVSVLPVILNADAKMEDRVLYWEFSKQLGDPNSGITGTVTQAARRGDWKAVRLTEDSSVELYNIITDKAEKNDIAADNPDIASEFASMFDARLAD